MTALTPWFSMNQAPVRSGVYQHRNNIGRAAYYTYYTYFNADTGVWGMYGLTPNSAHVRRNTRPHYAQSCLPLWRGILKEN